MGNRGPASCLAFLLAVGALAGCSGGSAKPGTAVPASLAAPTIPSSPTLPPGAQISLPLDAYGAANADDTATLARATDVLVAQCMRKMGFTYRPTASGTPPAAGPRPMAYGITDLAAARTRGYTAAGAGRAAGTTLAKDAAAARGGKVTLTGSGQNMTDLVREKGAAYVQALYGFVPPQTPPSEPVGCLSTAAAPMYDKAWRSVDRNLIGSLGDQAAQRTLADSRVVTVVKGWSRCMGTQGFTYGSPAQPAQAQWPAPVSSTEIATAVADVRCKQSTNLPAIWLAVESGYQRELIDRNAAALAEWQRAYQALLADATSIARSANGQ